MQIKIILTWNANKYVYIFCTEIKSTSYNSIWHSYYMRNSEKVAVEYNVATTPMCVAVWKLTTELKPKD